MSVQEPSHPSATLPTGTVTFLFTDIEGSTALWEQYPDSAHAALARHDALIETIAAVHGGQVVRPRGEGDSRFAVFIHATDALAAAAAMQQALYREPWLTPTPLRVRMALHTGEADLRAGDYYGAAVNRCARLRALAYGGQVLLSQATYDLVRDHPLPNAELRDLGEHRLKDLQRPEHIFQLIMSDLPTDLLSGRTIKGYELHDQLGVGSYGEVYRAYQPLVARDVAIKIIRPQLANHPDFIRRFEAEAQLVARLEHPHIVPLYDFWREPNGAYLVMRWIRGGSLEQMLQTGPMQLEVIIRLLEQIAAALLVAHRQFVVHGDLKPANILLDEDGNAYLADFGIARNPGIVQLTDLTHTYGLHDSPVYRAPEQITGELITPSTDIYSLGILLYQMLVGNHPFETTSPRELIGKHLQSPLPPLTASYLDLPAGLYDVLSTATAKDPRDRYADVVSLLADVQRVITVSKGETFTELVLTGRVKVLAAIAQKLENPYKGLRAFTGADEADFFGRASLTERLLDRLTEERVEGRFLAVIGPSGSGKSSVVHAGLIPAIRRGALPGSEHWFVVEIVPGAHPLEELEAGLLRVAVNPPPRLLGQLQADERGLVRAIKRVLPADDTTELILIIDQFEELFTVVTDEATRVHVLNSLVAAVRDSRSRLRLIVTLRADFYDRPLLYAGISELIRERSEIVLPLTATELEQAILGPARRVGLDVSPGLVPAIIRDVGTQPGALPLLQYALTELFERRAGHLLTLDAYEARGSVFEALGRRADELYAELTADEQEAARQIFLRLIMPGQGVEDTRRRIRASELAGDAAMLQKIVERYGRFRLLTFDHDAATREPTIEIAHEALIRTWGRLRTWLETSRDQIRLHMHVQLLAAEWAQSGHDSSFLVRGAQLAQLETLAVQPDLMLNAAEHTYLQASIAERERQGQVEQIRLARELDLAHQATEAARDAATSAEQAAAAQRVAAKRLRYLVGGLALFLVGTLALAAFAINRATTASANFSLSEAQRLAAESDRLFQTHGDADLVALLSLRSMQTRYTPQGDVALGNATQLAYVQRTFSGHRDGVWRVAVSPNGNYLLTASWDQTARLWDLHTGKELRVFEGHTGKVEAVAFAPNGNTIVTASFDRTARLWDLQTGKELRRFAGHTGHVLAAAFSPDGQTMVTGSQDMTAIIWNVQTGQQIRSLTGHTGSVTDVSFSPDGKYVFTGSDDTTIRMWDAATGGHVRTFTGHTQAISRLAVSPNGRELVSSSQDQTVRIWDVATGVEIRRLVGHADTVRDVSFSPDGKEILTGSQDRTARLWDSRTGAELRTFSGHADFVFSVAFSPDGESVVTGGGDGTGGGDTAVRLWPTHMYIGHPSFSGTNAVYSHDGKYVLTTIAGQPARLWNTATGKEIRAFGGEGNSGPTVAALSQDGQTVLTGGGGQSARLWDAATGTERSRLPELSATIFTATFSHDGTYILTNFANSADVVLWDARSGKQIRNFSGHSAPVFAVAFSFDDTAVATSSADQTIRIWNTQSGETMYTLSGATAPIFSVAFRPDSTQIVSGSLDGTVTLWDVQSRKALRTFNGHTAGVPAVAVSSNGGLVLTGSFDGTARLWDARSGEQLRVFALPDRVFTVAFSKDDSTVMISSADGTTRLWDIDYQTTMRALCGVLLRDFTADERMQYMITEGQTCS